ncbi:MAG: PQQ-binding-like beta-propeller repeat protein [Planctomycetota bacterium]
MIRTIRFSSTFCIRTLLSGVLLMLVVAGDGRCSAQLPGVRRPALPGAEDDTDHFNGFNSERRINQQLEQLSTAGKAGKTATVQEIVDSLRSADPMLIVPDPRGTLIPLHRDLVQRLLSMDAQTLNVIENTSGQMDDRLMSALNEGPDAILQVLHQTAGTSTGWKAHLLLAAIHHDRGNSLSARYWLRPLLTPLVPDDIRVAAERMSEEIQKRDEANGSSESGSADQKVDALKNEDESSTLRDQQKTESPEDASDDDDVPAEQNGNNPRANSGAPTSIPPENRPEDSVSQPPTSTAAAKPSDDFSALEQAPELFVDWMQRIPISDAERRVSQEIVQRAQSEKLIPWSAWEPLIDNTSVFVRTPWLIKAFDRSSGRHLWTKVIQRRAARDDELAVPVGPAFPQNQEDAVNRALNSTDFVTVHRNEIVGRLTGDQEHLYAVCQVVDGTTFRSADELRLGFMIDQSSSFSAGMWELIALEKSTGRRVWTAGGSPVENQFGNELSGAWFSGPPFVDGRNLLTVTERSGRADLVCLSASTGQLQWSAPLISPENEIGRDLQRQLQCSQIQVSEGVIFVTTAGWLFAVDELTHSLIWTRRLPVESQGENRAEMQFPRGVPVIRPLLPFDKVWRSETPIVSGNSLVLSSSECSQLLVVEMLTGRLLRRDSAGQSTLVLYRDDSTLVVSSDRQIHAKKLPSLEKRWSQSIEKGVAIPVGRAARCQQQLLIPMSDGTIAVRDLETGNFVRSMSGFRPARSAGGLYGPMIQPFAWIENIQPAEQKGQDPDNRSAALSASVLSFSPDFIAMLSLQPQELQPDQDPFQRASFLVETGQHEAAMEAIRSVPLHAMNAEPIRKLQFRIAIGKLTNQSGLSSSEETDIIQSLIETAKTPEERALAQLLRLRSLMDQKSPEFFSNLIQLLSSDESVLNVMVVPLARLEESIRNSSVAPMDPNNLETGLGSVRLPVRSLVMSHLREQLNDSDPEVVKTRLESLRNLSDADLLQLHHVSLVQEYLSRVERQLDTSELRESTAHFLMAAVSLNAENTSGRAGVLERVAQLLQRVRENAENDVIREPARAGMVRRLMQVLNYELLNGQDAADVPVPEDVARSVADRWKQLPNHEYMLTPVQTGGTQPYRQVNVRSVISAQSHDLFLSAFHWSIRREPGALMAQSLLNPGTSTWNLKLTAQENSVVYSDEEIHRIGSVILLQNSAGISAFSAIDHRWLWTRPVAGQSSRRRFMLDRMTFPNLRLSLHYQFGNPVGAFSYRWICLQSGSRIEVIDLLNGRNLWTMVHDSDLTLRVLGCEGLLGFQSGAGLNGGNLQLLNPLDGTVSTADVDRDAIGDRFLTGTADTLVMTEAGFGGRRKKSIQWIRPTTREVVHTFNIDEMESCTFLDANTLAIVSGDETFDVVDLQTAATHHVSFASPEEKLPEIDPSSIRIFCDAVNYYVTELDDDGAFQLLGMSMTENLEAIGKQLRVVSRVTGQIAWNTEFKKPSFAAFQADHVPFLLILNDDSPDARANRMIMPGLGGTAQKWSIQGFRRLDGLSRLNYKAQIRSVNGYVHLKQLEGDILDLDAFGSRVRFRPATTNAP